MVTDRHISFAIVVIDTETRAKQGAKQGETPLPSPVPLVFQQEEETSSLTTLLPRVPLFEISARDGRHDASTNEKQRW